MKGYVTSLNGKPLTECITTFQLGDCRRLFQHRAAHRGAFPTMAEIDQVLWSVLEAGEPLPKLYEPVTSAVP